jgi:hypothetical protein
VRSGPPDPDGLAAKVRCQADGRLRHPVLKAIETAITLGPYHLGYQFSAADV